MELAFLSKDQSACRISSYGGRALRGGVIWGSYIDLRRYPDDGRLTACLSVLRILSIFHFSYESHELSNKPPIRYHAKLRG